MVHFSRNCFQIHILQEQCSMACSWRDCITVVPIERYFRPSVRILRLRQAVMGCSKYCIVHRILLLLISWKSPVPDSCRLLSHHDAVRLSTVPFDHQFQSKPHRNSFFLPLDGSHFEVSSRFPCCVHQPLHSRLRGICLTHRPGSILCPSVPIFRQARACLVALSPETRG